MNKRINKRAVLARYLVLLSVLGGQMIYSIWWKMNALNWIVVGLTIIGLLLANKD